MELYSYMQDDNKEVIGYYAPEESEDLKGVLPWLGDERKLSEDDILRDVDYLVAARLMKIRLEMIEFIEKNGLNAGSYISSEAYCSKTVKIGKGAIILQLNYKELKFLIK